MAYTPISHRFQQWKNYRGGTFSNIQVIKGKDPQLEKAIEIALEQLKKNPPEKYERPDYPVRVRKGS